MDSNVVGFKRICLRMKEIMSALKKLHSGEYKRVKEQISC